MFFFQSKRLSRLIQNNWQNYYFAYPYVEVWKSNTYSTVQDITWKADCHSACKKISFLIEPEG
jgi:hypothetical protein